MKRFLTTLLILTLAPQLLPAQGVLVAPHVIYLDHRTRSGSLTLYNPGAETVEISISTLFGYPITDSLGNFQLKMVDDPDSTLPSAAKWLQAFPRRLTLGPKDRQTVRLLGRPPAGLADGEYWARLLVTAKGGAVPVSGITDTSAITVGLTLEVRTILPMIYRKGVVATGLDLSNLRARVSPDSVEVRVHLVRTGTGAFIGTVRGALIDPTGKAVASFSSPTAVYMEMDPRFTMPVAGRAPGRYRIRVEANSERDDIPSDLVLRIKPVTDSVEVQIP